MRAMRGRPADQRLSDEQLIQQLAGGDGELGAMGGVEGGKKRWVGTTRAQRREGVLNCGRRRVHRSYPGMAPCAPADATGYPRSRGPVE